MPVLKLKNISCAPWGDTLLEGLNLELEAGQIHGLIGTNGAGKSTLLRCISGEIQRCHGGIELLGRDLDQWQARNKARHLALLPQQALLNFPFTVSEVVALGRIPHTSGSRRDREIVAEAMAATDVAGMQKRLYTQLSGGEKQRVQLARIFAQVWTAAEHEYRLLLLDEPSSGLDLGHQQLLIALLRDMAKRGCAIVLVLHDFNILASVADTVSALHNGKMLAQGDVKDVFTRELFLEVFDSEVQILAHPQHHYPLVIQS